MNHAALASLAFEAATTSLDPETLKARLQALLEELDMGHQATKEWVDRLTPSSLGEKFENILFNIPGKLY